MQLDPLPGRLLSAELPLVTFEHFLAVMFNVTYLFNHPQTKNLICVREGDAYFDLSSSLRFHTTLAVRVVLALNRGKLILTTWPIGKAPVK